MKYRLIFAVASAITLGLNAPASGQTAPLQFHMRPYTMDTGLQASRAGESATRVAYITIVKVPGAPWLRLSFSGVSLGKSSYLTVTSLHDGAQQRLDARALAQWRNSSAYFNGDAVRIDLHLAPNESGVFARMSEVVVGEIGSPESQCGPTDDRTPSTDPRTGRVLSIGCTAWLIEDGRFVSAGHCVSSPSLINTVEFNVPPSLPNGTIQHPGPEDQYVVDDATRVFSDNGIGNDWGVFETLPNSQTGLTALQAQGSFFDVAQDLGPATIRITGFGVDDGVANQTEQTHTGPNAGSSGTTMRYKVDTEGGNSGSPVIDEATGVAVGVHTNAGCTAGGGFNTGTSTFNTALWAQIGNTGGGDIELTARVKRRGTMRAVNLRWDPSDGGTMNVLRDGAVVQTTPDDGKTQDNLGNTTGIFIYQVCETDSGDCSNELTVVVN
jgi:V8-like Glu-specific endopeptidase